MMLFSAGAARRAGGSAEFALCFDHVVVRLLIREVIDHQGDGLCRNQLSKFHHLLTGELVAVHDERPFSEGRGWLNWCWWRRLGSLATFGVTPFRCPASHRSVDKATAALAPCLLAAPLYLVKSPFAEFCHAVVGRVRVEQVPGVHGFLEGHVRQALCFDSGVEHGDGDLLVFVVDRV
jgi:hypothetical protein